jgi:hypothetical protein
MTNREDILRAVAAAAAEYRRTTGQSTEDLSLALALAELEFDAPVIDPEADR